MTEMDYEQEFKHLNHTPLALVKDNLPKLSFKQQMGLFSSILQRGFSNSNEVKNVSLQKHSEFLVAFLSSFTKQVTAGHLTPIFV